MSIDKVTWVVCDYCGKKEIASNDKWLPPGWVALEYEIAVKLYAVAVGSYPVPARGAAHFCSKDHTFNFLKGEILELGITPDKEDEHGPI